MDEKTLRAVALIAAALDRFPGDKDLYTRAEEHYERLREGKFTDLGDSV